MTNSCENNGLFLKEIFSRESRFGLTPEEASHMQTCSYCRSQLAKLEMLEGRMQRYVKSSLDQIPQRKLKLPQKETNKSSSLFASLLALINTHRFATAFVMLMIVVGIGYFYPEQKTRPAYMQKGTIVSGSLIRTNGENVTAGQEVTFVYDVFKVADSARIEFDGYCIDAENAQMTIMPNILVLNYGKLACEVVPGTPVHIKTSRIMLSVLGTRFTVFAEKNGATKVAVQAGLVLVTDLLSNKSQTLGPGDSRQFDPENAAELQAEMNETLVEEVATASKLIDHVVQPAVKDPAVGSVSDDTQTTVEIEESEEIPATTTEDAPALSLDDLMN